MQYIRYIAISVVFVCLSLPQILHIPHLVNTANMTCTQLSKYIEYRNVYEWSAHFLESIPRYRNIDVS